MKHRKLGSSTRIAKSLSTLIYWVSAAMFIAPTVSQFRAEEPLSVSVRVTLPSAEVCVGSSVLEAEAVFTNLSERMIEISPDGLHSNLAFAKYKDGKPIDGGGFLAEITPKSWVRIAPHQSIVVPFKVAINEKRSVSRLFDAPALFAFQVGFADFVHKQDGSYDFVGTVKSNKVFFLYSDCSRKH